MYLYLVICSYIYVYTDVQTFKKVQEFSFNSMMVANAVPSTLQDSALPVRRVNDLPGLICKKQT